MFWFLYNLCLKYCLFYEEFSAHRSSFKYPFFFFFFFSDFNQTWIYVIDFQKILMSNFMNICPVGFELFHARQTDGRTDRSDEAKSPYLKFCKRAWKLSIRSKVDYTILVMKLRTSSINWHVFVTKMVCVYCAVRTNERTEPLNIMQVNASI